VDNLASHDLIDNLAVPSYYEAVIPFDTATNTLHDFDTFTVMDDIDYQGITIPYIATTKEDAHAVELGTTDDEIIVGMLKVGVVLSLEHYKS